MRLYAKIGTHPQTIINVPRKRKLPVIGEQLNVIEECTGKKFSVIVDSIVDMVSYKLYKLDRM